MTTSHRSAVAHLRRVDPVLGEIIARVRKAPPPPRRAGTHYDALVRAIIYQQLSGKAAATIHRRFSELYPNKRPRAHLVLATSDEALRGAGLSRQKIGYLRDLSARVVDGSLPLAHLGRLPDDAIIEHLVRVKGIGRWTVQMFLMFRLGRPDVLPELDLGIQNAIQRAYGLKKRPKPKDVIRLGTKWRPHATTACWYMWRSLENGDGQLD
ncbi:MAG: DNA-3-methyladenine glycosylase 2 family protein [Gemmatimonadaceae bacterium]|nr:DNA-3-methyladenine glycosylase 2 family protein [Gemmatimonadaceae bacterium]NUO93968.1 DNA-3-methyladenine glycosylase 2 family protein [Gemmatimonadaceae bacterium]NUP54570.1 DNA-3-methyladenine glycosylase 2 family protein [Gemmatimonadaceae bacterium]NUP71748.1 DNA-3-methyladenine glycosylase 2 family protein [Gemmatimonadaceae bacterium]NUR33195.1 DNA-3-methyladenine glycosylase 2 family protein [Gemmatimonadaceae bacterium]